MKALGLVRKIDELGRVVVPMEVRKVNGWGPGTALEIFATHDSVIFRAYGNHCSVCGGDEELTKVTSGCICSKCLQEATSKQGGNS